MQDQKSNNRIPSILVILGVIVVIALTRLGGGTIFTSQETTPAGQESVSIAQDAEPTAQEDAPPSAAPSVGPVSGLPAVLWTELPPEAQETITLIDQGGPLPYDKDGSTFGNREELLPDRSQGHYKEYTVITPGSSDRGARRIVGGADGELYYTADHYASFREVIRE